MSGPGPGGFILGLFLFLFGLCFLLVGGGCTLMWLVGVVRSPAAALFSLPMLVISGGAAALGFVMMRAAGRLFRG